MPLQMLSQYRAPHSSMMAYAISAPSPMPYSSFAACLRRWYAKSGTDLASGAILGGGSDCKPE
eukprot:2826123-Rhodomonas_salina.2